MRVLIFLCLIASSLFGVEDERELLILGCARSGTVYISRLLQLCGMKIGHEKVNDDGACSWCMTVDTEKVPWGVARNHRPFAHIFHQVRHPLQVISSVYKTEPQKSWDFIKAHIPEIRLEDSKLAQCAKYWYYWNHMAERQAEWTYQVEEIEDRWMEFGMRLGRSLDQGQIVRVSKTTNSRGKHTVFTWEDLEKELDPGFFADLVLLSRKYGYL